MERLSGLDASFLYLETPTQHMHLALALQFDPSSVPGGYSFQKMKGFIASRIPFAPIFRRRLVEVPFRLGHPVWVDDPDFDIDYHVRLAAIPRPGGLRELADLAGDIAGQQLDRSRPLWEMWMVEGLAGGQVGLIAKMHHSTVDGISGAALLTTLLSLEPTPDPQPPPDDAAVNHRIPSGLELMSQALVARAIRPIEMTCDVVRTSRRVLDVRKVRLGSPDTSGRGKAALPLTAPRTSFNGALTRRRSVALTAIGLEDVKRLKNATGTTVNDIVLAVCTGALRTFLLAGDELPDRPLVAVVPVSVATDVSFQKGSNQLSSMFVQLPVDLDDPLERLRAIHDGTTGAKAEHSALGDDMLLSWAEHSTPNFFAGAARLYSKLRLSDRHRPIANLVISDVPGPDFPLYFGGAELKGGFPLGPVIDGMGLNITIMSYRGVLYWGIITCPETIPKIWDLTAEIPVALDELLARAGEPCAAYRPQSPGDRVRPSMGSGDDQGAGATAIDEAPEQTPIGEPNLPDAGA
jgi:WS/DGAT/MGAT family acyltransferase